MTFSTNSSFLFLIRVSVVLFGLLTLYGCAVPTQDVAETEPDPFDEIYDLDFKIDDMFSHNSLVEKDRLGLDFLIVSKESDYFIGLDFENKFSVMNLTDGSTFYVPATEVELSGDPDLFRYISKTESNSLIIQLHKTECVTEFSRKMDYEVAVDYTDVNMEGVRTFYGCGEYLADYSLHNVWTVVEFNGEPLSKEDFVKYFPVLEFNMATRAVFGTDGCNRVSTGVIVEHEKIGFSGFAGTRMACVKMEKGDQIMTAMSNQMFDYTLEEGVLTLYQNDKEIVVLRASE